MLAEQGGLQREVKDEPLACVQSSGKMLKADAKLLKAVQNPSTAASPICLPGGVSKLGEHTFLNQRPIKTAQLLQHASKGVSQVSQGGGGGKY